MYYIISELGWHTENKQNDGRNNNYYLKPFGVNIKGKKKNEMIYPEGLVPNSRLCSYLKAIKQKATLTSQTELSLLQVLYNFS